MNESFDESFCLYLECYLELAFSESHDERIKYFSCDGVMMPPPNQLHKKFINDKRKLTTKAWIGTDGQTEYEMIIQFGKYSLRRYAKSRSLTDCLPADEFSKSIIINIESKRIELMLR